MNMENDDTYFSKMIALIYKLIPKQMPKSLNQIFDLDVECSTILSRI